MRPYRHMVYAVTPEGKLISWHPGRPTVCHVLGQVVRITPWKGALSIYYRAGRKGHSLAIRTTQFVELSPEST